MAMRYEVHTATGLLVGVRQVFDGTTQPVLSMEHRCLHPRRHGKTGVEPM